jgi:glycosyltransferase involved in cell wall biosynthesis
MSEKKKQPHLLIIAIPFPTTRLVGSAIRVSKFIKYLPRNNWKISGLTSYWFEEDENIQMTDIHKIMRVPNPLEWLRSKNIKKRLSGGSVTSATLPGSGKFQQTLRKIASAIVVPDQYSFWVLASLRKSSKFAKKHNIEIVFSSSPYASCHLIGLWIKQATRLPWIADFRDMWVQNPLNPPKWGLSALIEKSLQKRVIEKADLITVTTDAIAEDLTARYPKAVDKITVLPNGFDVDDFSNLPESQPINPLILSHLGAFYFSRSPEVVLEVLDKIAVDTADLDTKIRLRFVGHSDARQKWWLKEWNYLPKNIVSIEPHVSHRNAIEIMASSHVLLLIPGADYAIPGKLYEYIASRRPVLALARPNTDSALLISRGNFGKVIHPEDKEELLTTFRFLCGLPTFEQINDFFNFEPNVAMLKQFQRDILADQLSDLLLSKIEL